MSQVLVPKYRTIRQSTLGDFDICQLRAQYKVAGWVPRGGSEASVCGTAYHAGLELYYAERAAGGPQNPTSDDIARYLVDAHRTLDAEVAGIEGFVWDTSADEAHHCVEVMVRAYFKDYYQWPDTFEILAVEHSFHHQFLPGWDATGTVDLVMRRTSDNFLVTDDHKTAGKMWSQSKADPRQNNQSAWYAIWVQEDFPGFDGFDAWFSVMRRDGAKFQRFQSPVDRRHMEAVSAKAESAARLLDSGLELPPNQSSALCSEKYCDAWTLCPFGAALA